MSRCISAARHLRARPTVRTLPALARELAGSLADAADDLATWATGRRPDRNGINGLIGWITGHRRNGNSVERLASWITGRKPR